MTDEPEPIVEPVVNDEGAVAAGDDAPSYRKIAPEVWAAMTIEEQIRAIAADVPQEVWDELPNDLSYQHDHYIYGTPKRPEPGTPEYEREGEALAAAELDAPVERLTYKDDIPPDVWEAMTIEEQIRAIVASVPAETWDDIPNDLSERRHRGGGGGPDTP